jgi:hypothetical protein
LLSQRIKCAELKSWCLGMLRECLVYSSMRLGVSFIAPRQLGAVECIPGRQFLPSVAWRTGQSGADFFPSLAKPTVGALEPLAHRTLSGAPFRPLARPRVSRGSRCRPLARPTVGSLDSPMNYICTSLITSREQQVRLSQPREPDTVRCTQTELTLAEQSHL